MTDQTMSSMATHNVTATAASSGMTLLVRYRRVRRAWYTGGGSVGQRHLGKNNDRQVRRAERSESCRSWTVMPKGSYGQPAA